jgi:DNA-binding response OmpR family regulator
MARKTILVIDSDIETAQKIESTLESEDYLVFIASTGEFGITMARKVNPALIFLNPAMSGTNGLRVCKTIHEIEEFRDVPVVSLSPFEGEPDPRYHSEYGIVDTLRKPFTPEELISKTAHVLSLSPLEAAPLGAEEFGFAEGAEEREKLEMAEIREKVPGEEPQFPEEHLKIGEVSEREDDRTFMPERPQRRRRGTGTRLLVPMVVIVVIVIIVAAAGVMLIKRSLVPGTKDRQTVTAKTPRPAQEGTTEVTLPQKPEQSVAQEKPVVPDLIPAPAPAPSPIAAAKPEPRAAGKVIFSVQVGAFTNERNADAVVRQFREKGYDAFVQTTPRDREMLHRVLIGQFKDSKEAAKLASDISNKEKVKTVVFKD